MEPRPDPDGRLDGALDALTVARARIQLLQRRLARGSRPLDDIAADLAAAELALRRAIDDLRALHAERATRGNGAEPESRRPEGREPLR